MKITKTRTKTLMPVSVNDAIEDLCSTMLNLSDKISCHGCSESYCCKMQKIIEISNNEFDARKKFITDEQKKRALKEFDIFDKTGLYTCPFNNPTNGKCEIYDYRFAVCASYGVMNPKEKCNSETKSMLKVVNPIIVLSAIKKENTIDYLKYAADGEVTDILKEFRKWMN